MNGRNRLGVIAGVCLLGCGHAPKPAGSVASIEVQYENNPASLSKSPKAKAADEPAYWQNRKDLIAAPAPPQATPLALPSVVRWKLKNGLDVIVVPRKDLPVVSVGFAIKAGGYDEDKAQSLGVADFTAADVTRVAQKYLVDANLTLVTLQPGAAKPGGAK